MHFADCTEFCGKSYMLQNYVAGLELENQTKFVAKLVFCTWNYFIRPPDIHPWVKKSELP